MIRVLAFLLRWPPARPRSSGSARPEKRHHRLGGVALRLGLVVLGLLVSATLTAPAAAQPSDDASFPLLRMESSARAAALGGAVTALRGTDAHRLFYNPALLTPTGRHAGASYLNHVSDINAGFLSYHQPLEAVGTVGAGLRFISWGRLQRANERGERTGTFTANDVALTVGAARQAGPNGRYGASLHLIHASIASARATALAADLGATYRIPAQQVTLSASLHNLGVTLDAYDVRRNRLPFDLRLGVSKRLQYLPLTLTLGGYNLHDLGAGPDTGTTLDRVFYHLTFGGEFEIADVFYARFGYNHRRSTELALNDRLDLAGLSAGFGVDISRLRVGYAYSSWSAYGGLHYFTLAARL